MAKSTPKKTANAAASTAATPKTLATEAAQTSSRAKKKPAAKKTASKEKKLLPDVSEENKGNKKAAGKTSAKKKATKKTKTTKADNKKKVGKKAASKKGVAKKSASAETTAQPGMTTKKTSSGKTVTAAEPVTDEVKDSATTAKTTKNNSSKKVPSTNSKTTSVDNSATQDPDYDDELEIDLPLSSQAAVVPYERNSSHYMDAQQLEHFRQKLSNWKQQLMEEVDRTVGHMKDDATNFPDPNDRATQEEEFSLELRTRDRERKLIKKINEAQKRIDDDDYGYCETCGIEIGVNRLEARPTAELCIDCKTLEEIRERQRA